MEVSVEHCVFCRREAKDSKPCRPTQTPSQYRSISQRLVVLLLVLKVVNVVYTCPNAALIAVYCFVCFGSWLLLLICRRSQAFPPRQGPSSCAVRPFAMPRSTHADSNFCCNGRRCNFLVVLTALYTARFASTDPKYEANIIDCPSRICKDERSRSSAGDTCCSAPYD